MERRTLPLILLTAALANAQPVSFQESTLHGRPAFVLENGKIRVSALRGGGHIAEVRFLSDDPRLRINPMRVPHYPTIDPHHYDPVKHDVLYGTTAHRWLSSGYMGHLLCFPAFGPPSSEEEVRNGLGNHGEAPIVEWKQTKPAEIDAKGAALYYAADLPKTQFRVERTIRLPAGTSVVHIEEWVENLAPFDRPVNWVQHATFGPPFVAPGNTMLDVSATKGIRAGQEVAWADSFREFPATPKSGAYHAYLLDQSRATNYFTIYNTQYPTLIGYLFPASDNPWIGDWQENQRNTTLPWNGQVIARGMEFGSTPFAEGLKRSVERGTLFGVPTYRWIGGRQRLNTWFTIFLAEIPADFAGVSDVQEEPGRIVVMERGSGRRLSVTGAVRSR